MTDQYGQQPPAPYPPPTPGGPSSPPPPPPGMFPEPGAPGPGTPPPVIARKKRNPLLYILGVIALVLILLVGACVAAVGIFSGARDNLQHIKLAETHFQAAKNDVEKASASLDKASGGTPASVSPAVAEATKNLRDSRDEIAKATAAVEQMKESQGRTDYLNSLKAATVTVDALQDLVDYVNTASGMASKATEAGKLTTAGNTALNNAVDSGNAGNYTIMRRRAALAVTDYTKAAVLFKQAAALDPSAGLDKATLYCEKRKQQADIVVRMAEEGKAGRTSAYNADIKKQAALSKQAEAVGMPAIVSDPNWVENRLADLKKKIEDASKQADDLRAKALKELGFTKDDN
jgi:hypothetical protein